LQAIHATATLRRRFVDEEASVDFENTVDVFELILQAYRICLIVGEHSSNEVSNGFQRAFWVVDYQLLRVENMFAQIYYAEQKERLTVSRAVCFFH